MAAERIRWAADSEDLAALEKLRGIDFAMTYADLFRTEADLAAFRAFMAPTVVEVGDRGLGDPLGLSSWIDVERGARRPEEVRGWLADRTAAGKVNPDGLTVYVGLNLLPAVIAHAGEHGWWRWIPYWQGGLTVPGHPAVMQQIASGEMLGARVDLSMIRNPAWHARATPAAATAAADPAAGVAVAPDPLTVTQAPA
jgi:hypothetical protein